MCSDDREEKPVRLMTTYALERELDYFERYSTKYRRPADLLRRQEVYAELKCRRRNSQ